MHRDEGSTGLARSTAHVLFLALDFLLIALALGVVFVVTAADGSGAEARS